MKKHQPVQEDKSDALEFSRRRNLPRVEVRIISSERSQDLYLRHHQLGDVGSMHKQYRRGRHVATMYILPKMEGDIRQQRTVTAEDIIRGATPR